MVSPAPSFGDGRYIEQDIEWKDGATAVCKGGNSARSTKALKVLIVGRNSSVFKIPHSSDFACLSSIHLFQRALEIPSLNSQYFVYNVTCVKPCVQSCKKETKFFEEGESGLLFRRGTYTTQYFVV